MTIHNIRPMNCRHCGATGIMPKQYKRDKYILCEYVCTNCGQLFFRGEKPIEEKPAEEKPKDDQANG